ncbi:MAG: cupin domain-containing protein [Proteobacteria bacterium]|nr:cupin domain-containing protein [Pseudomonadota bacterium]
MAKRKRRPSSGPAPRQRRPKPAAARPACIGHWSALEGADDSHYEGDDELMGIGAPLARLFGLTRLGIHHVRLRPGRRTSYPHAESAEEEFVLVLAGTPDAWLDGELHRLRPGDAVGFPAGTGLCHTFLNNTRSDVRLLVVGEASKPENRVHYPCDPSQRHRPDFWHDPPPRPMGPHDGLPDRVRARRARQR